MAHAFKRFVVFLLLVPILTQAAKAQGASIEGTWSGGGTAELKSGEKEVVRCRIRYTKDTGRTYLIHANCSVPGAGRYEETGRIVQLSETNFTGRLYSEQYSVSGEITITVRGNSQTLTAVSEKGRATVVLNR
jgi:hypothetical protein